MPTMAKIMFCTEDYNCTKTAVLMYFHWTIAIKHLPEQYASYAEDRRLRSSRT
jgi:hypothetical protein